MIDGLKPYAVLKETGVTSLGTVPEHWQVVPLCWVTRAKSLPGMTDRQLLSVYLDRGVVRFSDVGEKRTNVTSEDLSKYQAVDPGDLVLNNQQAWRGSVGISRHVGIVSPAYLVLAIVDRLNPDYANLLFRDKSMVEQYLVCSKGVGTIQRNLHWSSLKRACTLLPPRDEQAAIVRFLAHADRRIRRYIRAKQKLIKLLEEQKQAIIHRAVTRGLDPNVRLKASGVEWLGDVPADWPLYRAKLLFRQVARPIPEGAEMVTCFRDGQVTLRRNRRTEGFTNAIKELGYQGIGPGQLVLHSMDAFAGAIGVSDSAGKCSPEYVICEAARDGVLLKYYALLLRNLALRGLFVVLCPSVRERAPRVRYSDFGAFRIPRPPLREQERIVAGVSTACGGIERSLQAARRELELLREYRTRLIADVVTGKLDVREAAARLPDETDEAEPPEEAESLVDAEDDAAADPGAAPEETEA